MAFTVAPTSGTQPYLFTADISSKQSFDSGIYILQFYTSTSVGSCPAPISIGTSQSPVATALLSQGSYISTQSVVAGSCRGSNLVIRDARDNSIVDSSFVTISNI